MMCLHEISKNIRSSFPNNIALFNPRILVIVKNFIFQKGGSVSLRRGLHNNPDVKVSGEHAELLYLFQNRDKERFKLDERTRKISIIPRTFKGRQVITKLRELFL